MYLNGGRGLWPSNMPSQGYGTSVISPSTYDEQLTVYEQIARIADIVNEIQAKYNDILSKDYVTQEEFDGELAKLRLEMDELIERVMEIVESAHDSAISFNPTNGLRVEPISKVISDTYDNVRVHAFFALDYDDEGMTAQQYDELEWSARHYDLNAKGDAVWDELGAKQ